MKPRRKKLKPIRKKSNPKPLKPIKKNKKLKPKKKKKSDKNTEFKRVDRPGKNIVQRCMENTGSYPPVQRTYWGEPISTITFDEIWDLWQGNLSFMNDIRRDSLKKLIVGLAESQLWEVYTFLRDLGTRTQRRESVHGERIQKAINPPVEKKKPQLKKEKKK